MLANTIDIARRGRQQNVGRAAPLHQVTSHVQAVAKHPLRGGGFVVDVECVDVGAMVEQERRDLDGAGEVERSLAIASPGVHALRISLDELPQTVQVAQARRGVNVNDGPTLDGVRRKLGIGRMQIAKSARPPLALGVDVRSGRKQDVDHRATPRAGQGA